MGHRGERRSNRRIVAATTVIATATGAAFGLTYAAVGLLAGAVLGTVAVVVRHTRAQRAAAAVREQSFRRRALDELRPDQGPYRR